MSEGNPDLQRSYDSIAQAAPAMGCTVGQLRKYKKEGAPGFRGSRVYPAELLPWLKDREAKGEPELGNDREAWEVRRMRMQCEDMQRKWDREDEKSWDSNDVSIAWLTHLTTARAEYLKLATDLATRLAGRSALECEKIVRAGVELGLSKLRKNPYGERPICCPKCKEDITPKLILEKANNEGTLKDEKEGGEKSDRDVAVDPAAPQEKSGAAGKTSAAGGRVRQKKTRAAIPKA